MSERCGARTRAGGPCRSRPVSGAARCRMHGGMSTGPRTAEGKRRVGEATRARWVAAALTEGWEVAPSSALLLARSLLTASSGSRNRTARLLGLTPHGLRRVLTGLPCRPAELAILRSRGQRCDDLRVEAWQAVQES